MRYFTDNPLERLMMQKPSPGRRAKPPRRPQREHPVTTADVSEERAASFPAIAA